MNIICCEIFLVHSMVWLRKPAPGLHVSLVSLNPSEASLIHANWMLVSSLFSFGKTVSVHNPLQKSSKTVGNRVTKGQPLQHI